MLILRQLKMDLGLSGRTAIVCGASAGLGLACAESLAEDGANVVMFARREEELRSEASRLGALAVPGDVRIEADLERVVERRSALRGDRRRRLESEADRRPALRSQ
jgi:3-oxoacyl-[acyl-carrier protein] reductase